MKVTVNLEGLHRLSSFHRTQVLAASRVGCFGCLRIFSPKKIKTGCDVRGSFEDKNKDRTWRTACCPYCMVDSILPDRTFGFRVTKKLLVAMEARWFGRTFKRVRTSTRGATE